MIQLTKNSDIVIVLPKEPLKTEQFSAEELAKYLKLSLDGNPKIANERITGAYHFIIGGSKRNDTALSFIDAKAVSDEVSGPEGLYIHIREEDTILAGSEDHDGYNRGTLYAVYEFLERYLGCCFAAYSKEGAKAGETVPKHTKLTLPTEKYCKKAADLTYRTAIVQYDTWVGNAKHKLNRSFIGWLAKNRYNRILTWVGIYEQYISLGLVDELEKRGIQLSVGHHQASSTWLPPYGNRYFETKYYEEHPEFYLLYEDGTRHKPQSAQDYRGQLLYCSRGSKVAEEIAKNIVQWAKSNPIVDTIAFWPNDTVGPQCSCEKCRKYSKTDNYIYLENEIAKTVQKQLPSLKIDLLLYKDLWKPSEVAPLCENLVIDESTWSAKGLRTCGKPDGSDLIGTDLEKNLLSYSKVCKNLVFYEYYMGSFGNLQRLLPCADELQSIYKHFVKVGISGSGTQLECFNLWNHLLNFYCFARTAYDTSLTLAKQIKRICRLFGAAGRYMAQIFEIYENTLDGQVTVDKGGIYFAHNVDKQTVYELFDKALEETDDTVARNNLRLVRMAFRYTDLSSPDSGHTVSPAEADELDYMFTKFNSYLSGDGYGIAIPKRVETKAVFDDIWYRIDD